MASALESLKKIFSLGHKGPILGIDIGSSSIKVVLIEKVEEKVVLRNYGEVSIGPRAGVFAGQATNLPPEKIASALKDLLKEAEIAANHTLIAIPFTASLLAVAELPDVGSKELQTMVPIEARRYIPVPISEVSLDWWILPKRKAGIAAPPTTAGGADAKVHGKIDVIIAAIHNDIIQKYELIKRDAQIPGSSSHFEIEVFSTIRAIVGRNLSPTLVIDIGAGSTKLTLVDEGVVRGSHVVSSGSQDITLTLARATGVPFDKAEEIKCRVGIIGDEEGRDVLAAAELLLTNIFNEAIHFAENYERKYETTITKVVLVGGGARLMGIEKIVSKGFPKATVVIGNPFSRLDSPAFMGAKLKELGPCYAVAIGIALRGLEG
ncbi:MAG: type IV pilus assembly protein PilM [Candidatus Yonathbacteria bacterium]|nr:type IV pilus assembly protein PilM [Candidatus Yonathbacteria bacterium]